MDEPTTTRTPRHPALSGLLCVGGAIVLWSTAEVVTRTIIQDIGPFLLAAARFTLGSAFLLVFLPGELRRRSLRITRGVLWTATWMSIIGVIIASVSYQYSLKYAGAAIVATIFGASPLMVLFLAAMLLDEAITSAKVAGMSVGLCGIGVLSLSQSSATFSLLGLGLAVVCAFSFALFTVIVKKCAGPYAGLPITALCFVMGALFLIPMAIAEGDTTALAHVETLWLPVLYLAIGASGLPYLLYFMGIERVEATQAITLVLMKPPLAATLAVVCLGEPMTWNLVGGMGLILVGLYLVIALERRQVSRRLRG